MEKLKEILEANMAQGLIRCAPNEDGTLFIYNYTEQCQFNKSNWNFYTRMARGLILDVNGSMVARSFRKFFNVGETEETMASSLPTETPDVSMKLDGSLGILYKHKETYRIATRGSFTSEQAVKATEILRNKYAAVDFSKYPQHTFLFEIIYPENRIVVNYNDTEDLFLIGLVDTLSGYELPYPEVIKIADELGLKSVTVEQKDLDSILNDIDGAKGIEGFVLHFPLAQLRCKIKTDEYRTLHKTLSKLNRHFIWENLAKNIDISVLAGAIPDECYGWMKDQKSIFEGQFIEVDTKLERIFESIPKDLRTRKEFANYAKTVASGKELSILFKMYDKKPYDEIIWQILEPVGKIEAPRSMARRGSCDQN